MGGGHQAGQGWSGSSQAASPQPGSGCSRQHMKVCWLPPATRLSFKAASSTLCACMAAQQLCVHQHWVWELGRTATQQPCHPLLRETGACSMRGKGTGAQLSSLKERTITALTATRFCLEKTPRHPVPSSYDIPLTELKAATVTHTERARQGWKAQPLLQHPADSLAHWDEPGHRGSGPVSTHTARGRIIMRVQSYPGAAAEHSNRPGRNNLPHHYAGKRCNRQRHQG